MELPTRIGPETTRALAGRHEHFRDARGYADAGFDPWLSTSLLNPIYLVKWETVLDTAAHIQADVELFGIIILR